MRVLSVVSRTADYNKRVRKFAERLEFLQSRAGVDLCASQSAADGEVTREAAKDEPGGSAPR